MSKYLPLYKYCPVCNKEIPMQAIICLYCEEPLLPPDEPEDSIYGEVALITTVHSDAETLLDIIDSAEADADWTEEEYIRDPEDNAGEDWKRRQRRGE